MGAKLKFLASVAAVSLLFLCQSAKATVVGNDAINRANADGWSNFVLGLTSEIFTSAGTVQSWSVYTNNSGTLGMLLLRNTTGFNYTVVGADFETAAAGLNSFSFTPDTGVADVLAGDILGLFVGTSKVDWSSSGADSVRWCGSNGCIADANIQLAAGQTLALSGSGGRVYSANVTVPEPASLALLGIALAGLGVTRRTKPA